MKKIHSKIILAVLALLLLSFNSVTNWYTYESPDFKIAFPKKPTEENKKMQSQAGEIEVKSLTYKAQNANEKNLRFYFSVNEIPNVAKTEKLTSEEEKTFFDAGISGSVRNHKANLISNKLIQYNGYSGHEVKMTLNDDKIVASMRTYIVGNKYYGLIVYSSKQNDENSEIDFFFKSFEIKQ